MRFVQIKDGAFVRYITDIEPTIWDENNYCRIRDLPPDRLEHYGVFKLQLVTPPYFDPATQKREEAPAVLIDGVWTQQYIVSSLNSEQADKKSAELAQIARATRNELIAQTDWTQVADVPQATKDKYAAYRQALRDVPQQSGFPQNINWPEAP